MKNWKQTVTVRKCNRPQIFFKILQKHIAKELPGKGGDDEKQSSQLILWISRGTLKNIKFSKISLWAPKHSRVIIKATSEKSFRIAWKIDIYGESDFDENIVPYSQLLFTIP